MNEDKLKKLAALLKMIDGALTKKEFVQAFKLVVKIVKDLKAANRRDFQLIHAAFDRLSTKLQTDANTTLKTLRQQSEQTLKELTATVDKRLADIRDGRDGRDGIDGLDGRDGRDGKDADTALIEALQGEIERLSKEVKEKTGNTTRIGWGAHPLRIQGLGVTIDKNARVINFKGAGVSSVVRNRDGVIDVTLSGGGGSSGTLVSEEVPTNSGDDTNFTLANTPTEGTLRVYRGGSRLQSIGLTPDYSISGTTLTLTTPLNSAAGEIIMVDYSYA